MQCKVETPETVIEGKARSACSRMVIWLLLNGGMTACAIYGLFYQVEQAKNVLLFMVWSASVLLTMAAFNNDAKLAARAKGRSVPIWLSAGNDLIIMLALASVGRFFTAAAVLWQICCEAAIYRSEDKTTTR